MARLSQPANKAAKRLPEYLDFVCNGIFFIKGTGNKGVSTTEALLWRGSGGLLAIGKAETIHPLDRPVFSRLNDSHGFDLRCLPANFGGKLRTAPIVLLYLSPGFSETDVRIARSKEGQERYVRQRTGRLGFSDHHRRQQGGAGTG